MQAGEEVRAHVLDLGTHTLRGGFAGEDVPRCWEPSYCYLEPQSSPLSSNPNAAAASSSSPLLNPRAILTSHRRDGLEFSPISTSHFSDVATSVFETHMRSRLADFPMLVTGSPAFAEDVAGRELIAKQAFEVLRVPGIFFARAPVLSAFCVGKPNAFVIDCGHSHTTVTPVIDGYALGKSTATSAVEHGAAVSKRLRDAILAKLESGGVAAEEMLRPLYEVKAKQKGQGVDSVSLAYRQFAVNRLVDDAKEGLCAVAKERFQDLQGVAPKQYELPDGRSIDLGQERVLAVEPFVQTIPDLVMDSLGRTDRDHTKDLLGNVVLCGGNASWADLLFRLQLDLGSRTTGAARVKIHGLQANDRRFATWIGGSILSTLGTFQQMWVSRAEYEEHGVSIIHKKCP
eukprot:ANDGO_04441.mRNA.1 Actin-related protein 4